MKKTISLFILIAMMLTLFACTPKPALDTESQTSDEADDPVVSDTHEEADTKEADTTDIFVTDTSDTLPYTDDSVPDVDPTEPEGLPLPYENTKFYFSSGAGGWCTDLILRPDGSFEGSYYDNEMSEMGDSYPYGTVYVSIFKGKFSDIRKLNDYSYGMILEYIETQKPAGEEWIEEKQRFVATEALGISGGKEFILYLPQTPAHETDTDFLTWWPARYGNVDKNGLVKDTTLTLGCYGIHNVESGSGFFVYQ